MRTELFRNVVISAFLASSLSLAQQYPQPQYPPPQQYPAQQQPQYPQQNPQYPVYQQQQPQLDSPQQLQQLVGPIALYPDGLLAQVLTASTYPEQLPDAAGWANQHAYMHGEGLANAMRADNLRFAPAVMSLLPFPQVLSYLAGNMEWTERLSNAVLAQRNDVMDAVQYMRYQSYNYGYLRDPQFAQYERVNVIGPRTIEIQPVTPGLYCVPTYNPLVVYAPIRQRAFGGGFFSFGFGSVQIGAAFAPWGWGGSGFGWREHNILIDNRPWNRTYVNRGEYVHPYSQPFRVSEGPRVEGHYYGNDRHFDRHDDHRDERRDDHHDEHHDGHHDEHHER